MTSCSFRRCELDALAIVHDTFFFPGFGEPVAEQEVVERHDDDPRLGNTRRAVDEICDMLERPGGQAGIVGRVGPEHLRPGLAAARTADH